MEEKIDEELKQIEYMVEKLYQNDMIEIVDVLNQHFQNICHIMVTFINEIDQYNAMGLQIPKDILIHQLRNLMEAYESQDVIMLADVLKYEINEGLLFYKEILIQVRTNNNEQ